VITIPGSNRESIISDLMPDLTPLLDILFLLIVFLILTANAVPYAIDVNLPEDDQAVSKAVDDTNVLPITLLGDGKGWKIDGQTYQSESKFKTDLLVNFNKDKEQHIMIMGEKTVSMQKLLNLMTYLKKNNIQAVDILMERK
jgi:biopolymer transport protein ExbD